MNKGSFYQTSTTRPTLYTIQDKFRMIYSFLTNVKTRAIPYEHGILRHNKFWKLQKDNNGEKQISKQTKKT